jgi:RNA polymerase sigma-70 factor (ECF subfamily)
MDLDHSTRSAMLEAMPQLRAFAISLRQDFDRANDLAQETLLRACTNIEKFKAARTWRLGFAPFCTTSSVPTIASAAGRSRTPTECTRTRWRSSPTDRALEYEDVHTAPAELPNEMRQTLILIGVEGISYEQAARACNCSVGTVKSRAHRARLLSIEKPGDPGGHPSGRSIAIGSAPC